MAKIRLFYGSNDGHTEDTAIVSGRYMHSGTPTSIDLGREAVRQSRNTVRDFTTWKGDVEAARG